MKLKERMEYTETDKAYFANLLYHYRLKRKKAGTADNDWKLAEDILSRINTDDMLVRKYGQRMLERN